MEISSILYFRVAPLEAALYALCDLLSCQRGTWYVLSFAFRALFCTVESQLYSAFFVRARCCTGE
jgi:hypothetical protein